MSAIQEAAKRLGGVSPDVLGNDALKPLEDLLDSFHDRAKERESLLRQP